MDKENIYLVTISNLLNAIILVRFKLALANVPTPRILWTTGIYTNTPTLL